MRTIKFRAWDGVAMRSGQLFSITMQGGLLYDSGECGDKLLDYPIMQYTGFLDKNGIEIFEGDIAVCVCNGEKDIHEIKWTGEVLTLDYSSQGLLTLQSIGYEFEVIGNVYENPELLDEDNA